MRLCRGKKPRGARPSQVVVALFLALAMTPIRFDRPLENPQQNPQLARRRKLSSAAQLKRVVPSDYASSNAAVYITTTRLLQRCG